MAAADGDTVMPDNGVWSQSARTISWTVSAVAPGATSTLRYDVVVGSGTVGKATLNNSATATVTSMAGTVAGERDGASTTAAGYTATATDSVTATGATLAKSASTATATIAGPWTTPWTSLSPRASRSTT